MEVNCSGSWFSEGIYVSVVVSQFSKPGSIEYDSLGVLLLQQFQSNN